jgi:Zn-dependent peptidase ImmA (M78 family)
MSTTYDPWAHALTLGLTVIEERLPGTRRGEYWYDQRLVILTTDLSQRAARSTLTHEIQHHLAGDRPTVFGPLHRKAEVLANRRTALALIDPEEYRIAEQLRSGHHPSIAYELNVTQKVLADWLQLHSGTLVS